MLLVSFQLFVLQFFFLHEGDFNLLFLVFCDTFSYSQEDTITKMLIPVKHIKKHCCCNIPPPTELEHRIECVSAVFNSSRYSDGGIPLFGKKMPQVFAQLLVHVRNGCLSDVANVPLYRKVRTVNYFNNPKHPLPIWASARGTSKNEGFHPSLHEIERGSTMGDDLGHATSSDACYLWNRNQLKHQKQQFPPVFDLCKVAYAQQSYERAFQRPDPEYNVNHYCSATLTDYEVFGTIFLKQRRDDAQLTF